jgi:serine/threonine protein kinase
MPGTHWVDVKRLFEGALQQPARDRAKWLEACANVPLREEVLGLITSFERAADFLEQPACLPVHQAHVDPPCEPEPRFHPGDVLARYQILELLGEGGMGEVYSARDTRLDRVVVIKVLHADSEPRHEWRWRLEREARAVSSLSHPSVCRLYDIGQHGDTDFLVMEHLQGETLAARLEKGPLSLDEALRYGEQIADALVAAHQCGIDHRDLKPANIMLTSVGAKLLDFGIAKAAADGADTPLTRSATPRSLTEPGAVMGTLRYMAPEQIRGEPVDARTDIFALGALLFEMVTAEPAFDGEDRDQIFEAILHRDTPGVHALRRDIPRYFDRLVQRCTAKDRSARFQSAADVRRSLARAGRRRRLRKPLLWTAVPAVAVLALVAGVGPGRLAPFANDRNQSITLAVLPFVNSSGDVEQDYLSLGLTDQIASQMAR